LVFAMIWMGTRDIYIAFAMTCVFVLLADYLFNEESRMCCLPEGFTDYHLSLNEDGISKDTNGKPTEKEIEDAKNVLKRASETLDQ